MKNWGRVGSPKCNMRQFLPSLNSEDPEVAMNTEEMPQNIEPLFSRSLQSRQPV
jgi:hypothetical protein